MSFSNHILGHLCSNHGCGYISKTSFESCPNCSQAVSKSFYDFYQVLGLGSHFSPNELAKAYKKLSLKHHPDINPQGKPHFLLISEAYQTLKDNAAKSEYDRSLYHIRHLSQRPENHQSAYYPNRGFQNVRKETHQGTRFYYQTYTYQDFETIFKEFHRHRKKNVSPKRVSQIAGIFGAILGTLITILVFPIFFFLPGLVFGCFFGYVIGRLNPQLAPVLIKITNFVVLVSVFFFGAYFLFSRNIFFLSMTLLFFYFYLSASRSWEKEILG